jgi:protein LSM14
MSSEIIGKTLSLVTKANSRYQGTLVDVDTVKKTMSLKGVTNYGTEGRRNGQNEIPPSESILGLVKFKVELIEKFDIVPEESTTTQDPAIAEITAEEEKAAESETKKRPEKPKYDP